MSSISLLTNKENRDDSTKQRLGRPSKGEKLQPLKSTLIVTLLRFILPEREKPLVSLHVIVKGINDYTKYYWREIDDRIKRNLIGSLERRGSRVDSSC